MQTISRKKGKVFKEKVYLSNGKTVTKNSTSKTELKLWKEQMLAKRRSPEFNEAQSQKITLEQVFQKWIEHIQYTKALRTYENYSSDMQVHILPELGRKLVTSIRKEDVDHIVRQMKTKSLCNRTVNKIVTRLKQVLNYAIEHGYLLKNPASKYKELPERIRSDYYLTKAEVSQLLRANLNENIYPVLMLGLYTGLRPGELFGICWDRIDFVNNIIEVTRTVGRSGLKDDTKTHKKRVIPIKLEIRRLLESLLAKQRSSTFVLTKDNGQPFNLNNFNRRVFKEALQRAGLNESYTMYIMRHTFASQFMMSGGNLYDLQKLLGHTRIEQTQRYAHLSPQHLHQSMNHVNYDADDKVKSSQTALTVISV